MERIFKTITFIVVVLFVEFTLCDASRWKEYLSKKNISPTRSGGRIAGGLEAARDQFPFATIFFIYLSDKNETICSGSIISANYVLSAGHCFTSMSTADLLAGIHDITLEYPLYELEIFPTDVSVHSEFNRPPRSNDIAVVSTRRLPFRFSSPSLQPIIMAPRSFSSINLTGYTARVAGWGLTSDKGEMSPVPRYIDATILSNQECARTYGTLILDSNFCLSGANGRSSCQGDSGGGATIASGNTRYLMGIVSFGSEYGCQLGYPTVKARVTSYHNWITSITGIIIN